MVEREERRPENQPKVAGVIWKRLANDWALGIDATSRYPLDDWTNERAFRRALQDPDDPWNTRLRKGLPPGPISNPGLGSLEAALEPEEGPWWYYLHDAQGRLHMSRSAREHEAFRRRYNVY